MLVFFIFFLKSIT